MVNFKICVRNANSSGFWPVYIRVTNTRKVGYIKTPWVVDKRGVTKNGDVRDPYVIEHCSKKITEFIRRLNGIDTSDWGIGQVRDYLTGGEGELSFSAYARKYISRLEKLGHDGNARLYKASLKSLEEHMHSDSIAFSAMNKERIEEWIAGLGRTRRAKSLYPICIRAIFRDAMAASSDPSSTLPRLSYDFWTTVVIPESTPSGKRSIGVSECRRFFNVEIPDDKRSWPERIGLDMSLLSFCLAGINTVDIFNLKKTDYDGRIVSYNRTKTKTRRKDGAYIEIEANETARSIIEKYRASAASPNLLIFAERYNNARSFNAIVNKGICRICAKYLKMDAIQAYSFYTFRHSWATIAQNICGASLSEIGFAMNHLQDNAVTRDYIDIDFSPAWELNQKVYEAVFGASEAVQDGHSAMAVSVGEDVVSPDCMVYGRAYCRGALLAEVSDIGFQTTSGVISRLAEKMDIQLSEGTTVHFRIKNADTGKEIIVERMKGKGF